ncbi:MAG: DNA-packaging protein, partial [Gammaproteobacteria bacterium]|nr:DNA-packaging protein [Gammaproteobacteria bacterium]
ESARPERWAVRAIAAFRQHEADALVVEVNQGGQMAASVIGAIDAGVPVTSVRATRGKSLRAEPVAALYAQGRVKHAGAFPHLEDEMVALQFEQVAGGEQYRACESKPAPGGVPVARPEATEVHAVPQRDDPVRLRAKA